MEDLYFMSLAIGEALKALSIREVPVGAVIVKVGHVISRAHNQREGLPDATAHAEIRAIRKACKILNNWRLEGATIYVTKEPCIMCAGAIVNARLKRLVYGCDDLKAGAVMSLYNLLSDLRLNHQVEVTRGIMEERCRELLTDFFRNLRSKDNY